MLSRDEVIRRQQEAAEMFRKAGIYISEDEKQQIEIADFGIDAFEKTGLGVLVYVNTDRCCAKELAMRPGQTCPEHKHPTIGSVSGKEETFRCRWGKVYLYVEGEKSANPKCKPPAGREDTYNIWHEIELNRGDQYTLSPDTWHWFQAGDKGAVISEFSTRSTDESDQFSDKQIERFAKISD